jgi:hypothetical protein
MITSEPTSKGTHWLYATCDLCGQVCDFSSCMTRKFVSPNGGLITCPEGCKSEFTTTDDLLVNYAVECHAIELHRWRLVRDADGQRYLICTSHQESEVR